MTRWMAAFAATSLLAGCVFGQAYPVYGTARLFVAGNTAPGGATTMVLSSNVDKNLPYLLLYSTATNNPFILPDGRSIGINVFLPGSSVFDPLFYVSAFPGLGGEAIFGTPLPQSGVLDNVGIATKIDSIPNFPALIGMTFYCVALVVNPTASSGVQRISNVAAIKFRDPALAIHYIKIPNLPGVPGWTGTQSGTVGNIMNGSASGMCRIKAATPPPPGKGGIPEFTEVFEVRGWNNGQNGISENGGGDDESLGPVPVTWTDNTPNNVGAINATTGVFIAGSLTSTSSNGVAANYGTVTAAVSGAPGVTATKQIRVVPPDWVAPPIPGPQNLAAQVVGSTVVLTWGNPIAYSAIDVRRNGVTIAANLPGSTTTYTDTNNVSGAYAVRGKQGTQYSPWVTVSVGSVTQLNLTDESTQQVNIGFPFVYYGTTYNQMWVNSNGNITFGAGDPTGYQESASALQTGARRICGLWRDLDPGSGGLVLATTSATTYRLDFVQVPQYAVSDANSFFIELRSNNQIRIGWSAVQSLYGLVGIGPGNNLSNAPAINISSSVPYTGTPNMRIFELFPGSSTFDLNGMSRTFTPANVQGTQYQMTSP